MAFYSINCMIVIANDILKFLEHCIPCLFLPFCFCVGSDKAFLINRFAAPLSSFAAVSSKDNQIAFIIKHNQVWISVVDFTNFLMHRKHIVGLN